VLSRPDGLGVVLAPHLDDAVLSAWTALRHPGDVLVVNVCAGIPPAGTVGRFDPLLGVTDSAALVAQRLEEDAAALAIAGRRRVNFTFLDEQYRDAPLDAAVVGVTLAPALADASWLCAPAGIGRHADHVAVRDAALALAADLDVPISLYADLPYATWAGWPHWVTGAAPRPFLVPEVRWEADLTSCPVPAEARRPCPVALDDAEVAAKSRAVACYQSQFETLNGGPLGRITNPEVIGFELHWSVERP
jgi:LmbE family N-acetylglucosaminyl deacetylase